MISPVEFRLCPATMLLFVWDCRPGTRVVFSKGRRFHNGLIGVLIVIVLLLTINQNVGVWTSN